MFCNQIGVRNSSCNLNCFCTAWNKILLYHNKYVYCKKYYIIYNIHFTNCAFTSDYLQELSLDNLEILQSCLSSKDLVLSFCWCPFNSALRSLLFIFIQHAHSFFNFLSFSVVLVGTYFPKIRYIIVLFLCELITIFLGKSLPWSERQNSKWSNCVVTSFPYYSYELKACNIIYFIM